MSLQFCDGHVGLPATYRDKFYLEQYARLFGALANHIRARDEKNSEGKGTRFHQFAKFSLMIDLTAPYVGRAASCARNQPTLMVPSQSDGQNERERFPMLKTFDDMQKTSNANVDATVHSFEGATKATQAIATEVADYTKRSFESATKTMENLLGAKSPDKAFEVQSEYARAAYEDCVSHASKLGQLYTDLAKEAFRPYQSFVAK